jgi:ribosomal protein S18 acetylase RimI-like enzyme
MSEPLVLAAAGELSPATLHAAFASAFADYLVGPFTLPLEQWPQFTGRQGVDPGLSRAAMRAGAILAFVLVAPRPELRLWRLATMGAVPAARGSGAAPKLLDDFVARAAAAGCAQVELECFAQNERALGLYRSRGFEPLHELHGYSRAPGELADPGEAGEAVAPQDAFAWLDDVNATRGDLPLQVTAASLRALPAGLEARRWRTAQLVFSRTGDTVTFHSLVDLDAGQHAAQTLAAAVVRQYPACRAVVSQLQRPDLGGAALQRLGFQRGPLHQLMMRKGLQPARNGRI